VAARPLLVHLHAHVPPSLSRLRPRKSRPPVPATWPWPPRGAEQQQWPQLRVFCRSGVILRSGGTNE
jgi:hypothetical protein